MSKGASLSFLYQGISSLAVKALDNAPDLNHPLGLRRVSDTLASELFPGLSVYTRRAKYFSLISYWHSCGWLRNSSDYNKLDALLVWVTDFSHSSNTASLVGKDTMSKFKDNDILDPKNLPQIAIPSFNQYKNPFKQCNFMMEATESIAEDRETLELKTCSRLPDSVKSFVDEYMKTNRKLSRSEFRRNSFNSWQLMQLDAKEKQIIRNLLGIGNYKFQSQKAINRSLTLEVIESFLKDRKRHPSMRELVSYSSKFFRDSSFKSVYLGSSNPFKEIEIYDLYLTCLDVAFNSLIGLSILQKDLSLSFFQTMKYQRLEFSKFSELKDHFYSQLENETSGKKTSLLRAYKLACATLDRLKEMRPHQWHQTNILLKKNMSLVRDDRDLKWVDWFLQQHKVYSSARNIEAWITSTEDKLILHPKLFNYDYWKDIKHFDFTVKFKFQYRLGSMTSLIKDLL